MTGEPTPSTLAAFVLEEVRLLNAGDYEGWLALFADDGRYWVPLAGERQPDTPLHASLADEDHFLLATRVRRLRGPAAHSIDPGLRGLHVVQAPQVEDPVDGEYRLSTPFVYTELTGAIQTQLGGIWRHRLRRTPNGLRIALKRVDLLQAGLPLEMIQLFP